MDDVQSVTAIGRSSAMTETFPHVATRNDEEIAAPVPAALRAAGADLRYRYETLDLLNGPALTAALARLRPTHIIHLAGALYGSPMPELTRGNIDAIDSLYQAIVGANVPAPRVVIGGTCGVYGVPETLPIAESARPTPTNAYGVSKLAAEHLARVAGDQHDIPTVTARIFNPIGPGQDERHLSSSLAAQIATIAAGGGKPELRVGDLSSTRDFIDVRDVASALCRLALRPDAEGIYNVGSGVETRCARLLDELLDLAGLPELPIRRRPGRPGDIPRHVADIGRLQALGFECAFTVRDALSAIADYYRLEVHGAVGDRSVVKQRCVERVHVEAARVDRYDVVVSPGLLASLPERLSARFPGARLCVLTDTNVCQLYGDKLVSRLREHGCAADLLVMGAGERHKRPESARRLYESLHESGFDRRAVLVLLGGGLVTDVGGFVAATYMRGVRYVNVPTTLLGQHDAAVGGKVAVNMPWAKNFVGAFHHPQAVFVDPEVLATLDDRNMAAGIAESIKVAICGDAALFRLLESSVDAVRERAPDELGRIVARSIAGKAALLHPDPYEVDLRRPLNLGHGFGHALETEIGYRGLLHGEAVAFGIAVATEIARSRRVCSDADADRIARVLRRYRLPPAVPAGALERCVRHMDAIRLVRGGSLLFVLPAGIDRVRIVGEVSGDELREAIAAIANHEQFAGIVATGEAVA